MRNRNVGLALLLSLVALLLLALTGIQMYCMVCKIQQKEGKILSDEMYKSLQELRLNDENVTMNDIFDKIYYIALPERLDNIKAVLKSYNIRAEKIDPVIKYDLDSRNFVKDNLILRKYFGVNAGRVACHLSHLKALRTFLKSDAKTALILEDDLADCKNLQRYQKRLNSLRDEARLLDWDILYLGHCWANCKKFEKVTDQIYKNGSPICLHAYAVTRHAAQVILQKTMPMYDNGDEMLRKLGNRGVLRVYTVMPPIFFQNREKLGSTLNNWDMCKVCGDVEFDVRYIEDEENIMQ